jgi:hypothetical protein
MEELQIDYTTFKTVRSNINGTIYYFQDTVGPDSYYLVLVLNSDIFTTLITAGGDITDFLTNLSEVSFVASSKNAALALAISASYSKSIFKDGGYKELYDLSDNNTYYIGTAPIDSLTSAAVWTIKKVILSSGSPVSTQWSSKKAIWNDRLTELYS